MRSFRSSEFRVPTTNHGLETLTTLLVSTHMHSNFVSASVDGCRREPGSCCLYRVGCAAPCFAAACRSFMRCAASMVVCACSMLARGTPQPKVLPVCCVVHSLVCGLLKCAAHLAVVLLVSSINMVCQNLASSGVAKGPLGVVREGFIVVPAAVRVCVPTSRAIAFSWCSFQRFLNILYRVPALAELPGVCIVCCCLPQLLKVCFSEICGLLRACWVTAACAYVATRAGFRVTQPWTPGFTNPEPKPIYTLAMALAHTLCNAAVVGGGDYRLSHSCAAV